MIITITFDQSENVKFAYLYARYGAPLTSRQNHFAAAVIATDCRTTIQPKLSPISTHFIVANDVSDVEFRELWYMEYIDVEKPWFYDVYGHIKAGVIRIITVAHVILLW